MMWDCINRFFGIGLKPLPATYSVKKIAINLILLALLRVAFVLSSHGFLEPYYILIVNIIFVSIEIFIHGLLIIGAHEELNIILYVWMVLISFCFVYMVYFVWFIIGLLSIRSVSGDNYNKNIICIIIAGSILEIL